MNNNKSISNMTPTGRLQSGTKRHNCYCNFTSRITLLLPRKLFLQFLQDIDLYTWYSRPKKPPEAREGRK